MVKNDDVRRAVPEEIMQKSDEFKSGEQYGRLWVTKKEPRADRDALARLDEFYSSLGTDSDSWFCDDVPTSSFTAAERACFVLEPDDDGSRKVAREFWESVTWPEKTNGPSAEFVHGFVVGALEAWDELTAHR